MKREVDETQYGSIGGSDLHLWVELPASFRRVQYEDETRGLAWCHRDFPVSSSKEVAHRNAKRMVEVAPATFVEVRVRIIEICDVHVWRVVPLGDVLDVALEGVLTGALVELERADVDFVVRDIGDIDYKLHLVNPYRAFVREFCCGRRT